MKYQWWEGAQGGGRAARCPSTISEKAKYRHFCVMLPDSKKVVFSQFILQPADIGLPTGNGNKLSCTQAQLGQETGLAVA